MTSTGAAFFDLDRTLVAGASGQIFADAMRESGLTSAAFPGERLLFGLFNVVGETLPSMVLARQAVALATGRSQDEVRRAAVGVAERLVELVQPFAATEFAMHREAGRPIVLATTTPSDLVEPFAERLGLDDVVATRYSVAPDGTYDGTLDGPFVWSAGKLAAITEWAERNGVDLDESYAYSDSVYDSPMLSAVGHPYVVNPDPRLVVLAAARGWPQIDLGTSSGVAKVPVVGLDVQKLALGLAHPAAYPYARFDIAGVDQVPSSGGAILCANHRSYFDVAALSIVVARSGRTARFLGKKEIFDAPVIGPIAAAMGGISVDRATGSGEPLEAAVDAVEAGELVVIMPQGTIPRGPAFFDPVLTGRWGAARLAELTGAPIVPVGLWGTERVWPRSSRLPDVLNLTDPPIVRVRVGEPLTPSAESLDDDTAEIMTAITDLLPASAREARDPTPEDLDRTYPPGWSGEPAAEPDRGGGSPN
ncbi:MAG: HAD-IB family hydrolase [Ilumatobacteraceae bacterium]